MKREQEDVINKARCAICEHEAMGFMKKIVLTGTQNPSINISVDYCNGCKEKVYGFLEDINLYIKQTIKKW